MKNLLSLVLVLALCGVVTAGMVDLKIASKDGQPIPLTKEIMIEPSDVLDMDLYWTSDNGQNLFSLSIDIIVEGPGTITNMHTGNMAANPDLTFPSGIWDAGFTKITQVTAGKRYTVELVAAMYGLGYANPPGAPILEPGVIAMDHILFHLDGIGVATIAMAFNYNTATADSIDYPGVVEPTLGGPVTIMDIPEPATIALLCLGGLLLRKKK